MRGSALSLLIGLVAVVAACTSTAPGWTVTVATPMVSPAAASPTSPASSGTPLGISNGLTVPVTVAVNGSTIVTIPDGTLVSPIEASLPPLPWSVEARSPSGRVLLTLEIPVGTYVSATSGMGARADLACGRLDIFAGPPMMGPVFMPDPSRPCD